MAAAREELNELHSLIARSLTQRLQEDIKDSIPTDAATLGAAIKFLKDNEVTADPASNDDLLNLKDQFKQAQERRRTKAQSVLGLVKDDIKEATG